MAGEVKRAARVAESIREELAMLLTTQVRDPRLSGVLVSRVVLSDDLRSARVFFRMLCGGDDEARRKEALTGLSRASGMFRKEITNKLGLRFAPDFKFTYDAGQEARDRIEALLAEVKSEKRS